MMQLKLSAKGEIVIPKKIREQLGLIRSRIVILDVKDSVVSLRPARQSIARKWAERAKKLKIDTSKWVLGDKLYEEGWGF
jgi:AbrB family looped-hinge helix DNA binding protein